MSGNIYQRKDGRFEGRISLGKSGTTVHSSERPKMK